MKKIVKQVAGIDVAQKELVVSLGRMFDDLSHEVYRAKTFANTTKGIIAFVSWVRKETDPQIAVRYVMEATGVYHESLAYFLHDQGYMVSIVLPNKISNYFRTLDVKTSTDKTCAEAITRFGMERTLDVWKKPKAIFKRLRQLTREREQIVQERTITKNHLHAERAEAEPNASSIRRISKRIAFLNKQEKEVLQEIHLVLKGDEEVRKSVTVICTIPGVGILTAVSVLAETNGFELVRNKKQLVSYAGLDVKLKDSGTSVKSKPRISKKGNKYLRKAMHLPALAAIRHDERFKAVYARLVSKHGVKMKAAVAIHRKLLEMIYTMFRTNIPFDKDYCNKYQVNDQLQKVY